MSSPKHTYSRDAIQSVLFCLFLLLPVAGMWWPLDPAPKLSETRTLASRPNGPKGWTQWKAYPDAVSAWFEDHYGFRKSLVAGHGFGVMSGWLHHKKILSGRDGWLFFRGNNEDWVTQDALGMRPLTEKQIEHIRAAEQQRVDYMRQKQITYIAAVVPNKCTANRDRYPFAKIGRSRLDQLMAAGVPFLDLRPVLETGSDGHSFYKSRDTHWTDEGAFRGAEAILRALDINLPTQAEARVVAKYGEGDLINMLGIGAYTNVLCATRVYQTPPVIPCEVSQFILSDGRQVPPDELDMDVDQALREQVPHIRHGQPDGPVALIFHDSFGVALAPWIATPFSKAVFVWMMPKKKDVEWWMGFVHPDVVIECHVERHAVMPYLYEATDAAPF